MINNKGNEIENNKSKFLSSAAEMHNKLGHEFCLTKWQQEIKQELTL